MNSFLIFIILVPALEIFVFIKVGGAIGAMSTIFLIILTAVIGIYFAKLEGLSTLRSGIENVYKNKSPLFEIISGASIAVAAILLIFPGFITDTCGFLLLFPFVRKFLIKKVLGKNKNEKNNNDVIEAEILEDKKDEL